MAYGYKVRKAAQVAAFFALKEGGSISVLKLAKLLYLADREHLHEYDLPILFDRFVSMNHGPVTSITLDCINGLAGSQREWETFITGRSHYNIGVKKGISENRLDELSRAEIRTLEVVWKQFGGMTQYQIRDWTHNKCGEWEDPHGSSTPIPYERVLKFLGKEHAAQIAAEIEGIRSVDTVLENAR